MIQMFISTNEHNLCNFKYTIKCPIKWTYIKPTVNM